jgi:hypothetical protein
MEGGDSRQSTVLPPALPSISSIRAAINALHRLAEFFTSEDVPMATQPAVDSQMRVDNIDLLSSAFDRLHGLVLGSAWAEQIQWELFFLKSVFIYLGTMAVRSLTLVFRDPKGKPLRPTYVNGGTWL